MPLPAAVTREQARDPEFSPGNGLVIPLGIQHVLAMFVSNLTPPIIIAGAAGFGFGSRDPWQLISMIQMSMLFAGIATLIQTVGRGPIGARLPPVQGTSFAYIPVMFPIVAGKGVEAMAALTTAALIGGLVYAALSVFVGRVRFALPPLIIGLSSMRIGVQYSAGGVPEIGTPAFGAGESWLLASYLAALTMGRISFEAVAAAPVVMLPSPFHFGFVLSASAIVGFVLAGFVFSIESIGDVEAICEGTAGRLAIDAELQGAVAADGVGTARAAVFGAMPNTTFSQNVGLMAITSMMSRHVVTLGAGFLIMCWLVFGVSLSLALGLRLEPAAAMYLPETLRILVTSGVLPAAVLAIVRNLVLPHETADEEAPALPLAAAD